MMRSRTPAWLTARLHRPPRRAAEHPERRIASLAASERRIYPNQIRGSRGRRSRGTQAARASVVRGLARNRGGPYAPPPMRTRSTHARPAAATGRPSTPLDPPAPRPGPPFPPPRPLVAAAIVASIALLLHVRHYRPFLADDALISLRYANRLLHGHGLTWTDGPRVEGYSNLLWVLMNAGLGAL